MEADFDEVVMARRHPYAKCEQCPLREAGLYVPSDGPPVAEIAFVGEAAGKNEVNVGKPFVGDSGRLLTQVLTHYGIDRRKALLTNATLCRPPGLENLSPPQGAVKACRPRLVQEIEERGVKTVVALGNVAAQSLLASSEGVTKLRVGLGHKSPFLDDGARVLATFHPAACLRSADFFPSMVADLGKINRKQSVWEPPKYVVYDTPREAIAALREIKNHTGEKLVIDIETDKEKDCLAPGTRLLKRDLTWTSIENLIAGDELVAFDDNNVCQMKPATVTATRRLVKKCYRVTTERGTLICSGNHQWPVKTRGQKGYWTQYRWRSTEWLFENYLNSDTTTHHIPWLVEPWEVDNTRDGGYVAGLLDGEGTLLISDPEKGRYPKYCAISQNAGPVFDRTVEILEKAGFKLQIGNRDGENSPQYVQVSSREDILRMVGMYRPERFMSRAESIWVGHRNYWPSEILSIEPVGEQEVVALKTSTGTFVAEGHLSHNSDFDHPNKYELLCIGLAYARKKVVVLERNALKHSAVLEQLGDTLRAKRLVAQNGKYDCAGLYPKVGPLVLYFDTMLASYALDERRGIHSLDYQAVEKLGTPNWKSALDKYNPKKLGYGVIPVDVLDKYNAYDCATTWELAEYYEKELEKSDLRKLHDFLVSASNELMFLELNGITIDQRYNDQLTAEYLEILEEIRNGLVGIIDEPDWGAFNPNSPKQVKEVLEDVFDISIPLKRNQKGQLAKSTDEETLTNLSEKFEPTSREFDFLSTMLTHRKHAKYYGTYVKGIRQRLYRGRVYPTFLLHGTTTGRLSCRNPNLQNIPRGNKIRSQFVPANPGSVFVQVDYSQAELRVLTWLAQEEYFRDIFNDGTRDLFNELAPVLYGDLSHLDPAAKKEKRIRVKAYVYGLSYGREALSIAQEFKISVHEAVRGMEAFFGVIPNIVAYQKEVERTIRACEDLTTPFGRHRRFHLLTPNNITTTIKEGLAFRPQSISSDICLQAFTWARPALKGKAFIRNLVHDSILAETSEENAEYVAKTLDELMLESARTVVGDYVRFATEATIGRSWGDV